MHGLIWGLLGASAGLAFAVGLGEPRLCGKVLTAGFVGAVLGTVAFELIGGVAFPMAETGEPISETWATRLMARLLVTVGTALIVILLLPDRARAPSAPSRRPGAAALMSDRLSEIRVAWVKPNRQPTVGFTRPTRVGRRSRTRRAMDPDVVVGEEAVEPVVRDLGHVAAQAIPSRVDRAGGSAGRFGLLGVSGRDWPGGREWQDRHFAS